jgi:hypothetical protein
MRHFVQSIGISTARYEQAPIAVCFPLCRNWSDEERVALERRARRFRPALAIRSRIVLGSAEVLTDVAVAARCGAPTVAKWRRRFLERRLDRLVDDARPGRPARIATGQVGNVASRRWNRR